jgi:hypothetical protein
MRVSECRPLADKKGGETGRVEILFWRVSTKKRYGAVGHEEAKVEILMKNQ